jgi:hypothetical protein
MTNNKNKLYKSFQNLLIMEWSEDDKKIWLNVEFYCSILYLSLYFS